MSIVDTIESEIHAAESAVAAEAGKAKAAVVGEFEALVARVHAIEVKLGFVHDAAGQPVKPA